MFILYVLMSLLSYLSAHRHVFGFKGFYNYCSVLWHLHHCPLAKVQRKTGTAKLFDRKRKKMMNKFAATQAFRLFDEPPLGGKRWVLFRKRWVLFRKRWVLFRKRWALFRRWASGGQRRGGERSRPRVRAAPGSVFGTYVEMREGNVSFQTFFCEK